MSARAPSPRRAEVRRGPVRVVLGLVAVAAAVVASYVVYRSYVRLVPGVEERAFQNAGRLLAFQQRAGLDWEQAAQRSPLGTGGAGAALTAFYALAYWPFVLASIAVTFLRDRPTFRLLRNALLITGAVGLLMILAAPVAPPRLLDGFDDRVADAGLHAVAHPSSLFNPYAAVPSFHVGWTVLAAVALSAGTHRHSVRGVLATVPVAMSVAVVTTGNHYVLDVVAGLALAVVGWGLAPVMERGFDGHRSRMAARAVELRRDQSRPRLHIASRSWRL